MTRRRREASLGKRPATRVRRLSSLLTRSRALVVRSRRWWAAGKAKTVKPCGQIFLHPGGEFGSGLGIGGDDFLEAGFGAGRSGQSKTLRMACGDGGALIQARDIGLGVLLEMELAALPGHGGEDGGAGGAQAGMVIADDEQDAVEAALLQEL